MEEKTLKISAADVKKEADDRFHRFSLIGWWNQEQLLNAKILVIGAGALGNEIVKNLALLGVGNLLIADLDKVENSNLSRSVLYRQKDNGRPKAFVAAESAKTIFPEIRVQPFHGNIVYDLGLGVFDWADVVVAGLDNREARLSINRNCWKVGKPWIDGAIETISGVAKVFVPDGPCYECTMSEMDWTLLNKRRSCNLLTRNEMETGKTPTTPTISSIIAGVQCQEAVKLLHGMPTLSGKGFVFNGETGDSYIIEYQRNGECYSHDTATKIISLSCRTSEMVVEDLLAQAIAKLGEGAVLELGRDILEFFYCPTCKTKQYMYCSLGKVDASLAVCPDCGTRRAVTAMFIIKKDSEGCLRKTFAEIGVPQFDIVWARNGGVLIGFRFQGDADDVLGELNKEPCG